MISSPLVVADDGGNGAPSPRPPRLASAALGLLLPEELRDEMLGDLEERFRERARTSRPRAVLWYWSEVIRTRPIELRRVLRAARGGRESTGGAGTMKGGMTAGLVGDVRQGLRALVKRPGMSLTVAGTVALAIGATTSVFSVVNGVLLRPLDYPEPDRLVNAWQTRPAWLDHPNPQLRAFGERFPLSVPTFNDWAEARTGFESLGIYTGQSWVLQEDDGADIVRGLRVTSGVFAALGVPAQLGRTLLPADDEIGAPQAAVLSHSMWQERFGGDPGVVGRALGMSGTPYEVVGVMPEGFVVPGGSGELWGSFTEEEKLDERDSQSYTVLGRLRPGATVESLDADLEAIQTRLAEAYPEQQGENGARVQGLLDTMVGGVRSTLLFLLAAVGLVLLIACVNIANVLSVMGLIRRRELAVKAALGASRRRLVRGLLTESAVLAAIGGMGGVLLSIFTLPLLARVLPSSLPRSEAIAVDGRVLLFGLGVTALTAIVAGVLPALQVARTQPKQVIDQGSRGLAGGRAGERARSALVVAEVALAFTLLVGASLLTTSFLRLWNVDRGFASEGLIAMSVTPSPEDFPEGENSDRFRRELRERLEAIPGVRASLTNQIPLSGSSSSTTYHLDRADGTQEDITLMISVVGEDYFEIVEIPLVEGRTFGPEDFAPGDEIGIVNQALVDRYWPGESAVGKGLRRDEDGPLTTIVGVVRNVRHQGLSEPAEPKLYVPSARTERWANSWVIRAQGDPAPVIELARQAVAEVSPSTPVRSIEVLDERIARSVAVPRFRTWFVVGLAGIATILALLGVYGVLSFAVSQRTRELAVRMAIGARPEAVVGSTIGNGLRLAAGGIGLGLLISWQGARLLEEFLFEIEPLNPAIYAGAVLLVGMVGVLASWLPARRASRVDPAQVLNAE